MKFVILLLFVLISCGKSPFLDESSSSKNNANQNINMSEQIELDLGIRDGQNSGENSIGTYEFTGIWQVGPSTSGKNKMLIIIKDQSGNRAKIEHDLQAFLWMPEMGHGSSPIKTTKIDDGIYELTNISFIMSGLWDMHFEFKYNDIVVEEVIWDLNL
jgi:hypothetical protein